MADLSDLESAVCDVDDMADVVKILITKANVEMQAASGMKVSAEAAFKCTAYWRDAAEFATMHLAGMISSLKRDFFEVIEKN